MGLNPNAAYQGQSYPTPFSFILPQTPQASSSSLTATAASPDTYYLGSPLLSSQVSATPQLTAHLSYPLTPAVALPIIQNYNFSRNMFASQLTANYPAHIPLPLPLFQQLFPTYTFLIPTLNPNYLPIFPAPLPFMMPHASPVIAPAPLPTPILAEADRINKVGVGALKKAIRIKPRKGSYIAKRDSNKELRLEPARAIRTLEKNSRGEKLSKCSACARLYPSNNISAHIKRHIYKIDSEPDVDKEQGEAKKRA